MSKFNLFVIFLLLVFFNCCDTGRCDVPNAYIFTVPDSHHLSRILNLPSLKSLGENDDLKHALQHNPVIVFVIPPGKQTYTTKIDGKDTIVSDWYVFFYTPDKPLGHPVAVKEKQFVLLRTFAISDTAKHLSDGAEALEALAKKDMPRYQEAMKNLKQRHQKLAEADRIEPELLLGELFNDTQLPKDEYSDFMTGAVNKYKSYAYNDVKNDIFLNPINNNGTIIVTSGAQRISYNDLNKKLPSSYTPQYMPEDFTDVYAFAKRLHQTGTLDPIALYLSDSKTGLSLDTLERLSKFTADPYSPMQDKFLLQKGLSRDLNSIINRQNLLDNPILIGLVNKQNDIPIASLKNGDRSFVNRIILDSLLPSELPKTPDRGVPFFVKGHAYTKMMNGDISVIFSLNEKDIGAKMDPRRLKISEYKEYAGYIPVLEKK